MIWNNGNPFPTSPESIIEVIDDANRIVADPLLGSQEGFILPRWVPAGNQFADGSTTIQQVFEGLVNAYGTPSSGSPAIDAADPGYMPGEDILEKPRPVGFQHDIGAVEYGVGVYLPLVFGQKTN